MLSYKKYKDFNITLKDKLFFILWTQISFHIIGVIVWLIFGALSTEYKIKIYGLFIDANNGVLPRIISIRKRYCYEWFYSPNQAINQNLASASGLRQCFWIKFNGHCFIGTDYCWLKNWRVLPCHFRRYILVISKMKNDIHKYKEQNSIYHNKI